MTTIAEELHEIAKQIEKDHMARGFDQVWSSRLTALAERAEKERALDDVRKLAMEGLDYFAKFGTAEDRVYVRAIRTLLAVAPKPPLE